MTWPARFYGSIREIKLTPLVSLAPLMQGGLCLVMVCLKAPNSHSSAISEIVIMMKAPEEKISVQRSAPWFSGHDRKTGGPPVWL